MKHRLKQSLALFDFDGTLTTKDSLLDFLLYLYGWKKVFVGAFFLMPTLTLYVIKLIPNDVAKRKVIRYFMKGKNYSDLKEKGNIYGKSSLPKILRKEAVDKLEWHKQKGHKVFVVTASSEIWLDGWAQSEKLGLIGTKYQVINGELSGDYEGLNCHGLEKVRRIKEEISLEDYDEIYAYGDTKGDYPMLSLANHAFFKCFD